MKFAEYLQERFVLSFGKGKSYCEVFADPDKKEMIKDIKGSYARFFYINGTLYVWDAEKTTHFTVADELKVNYSDLIFGGIGEIKQGKIYYGFKDWHCDLFFASRLRAKVLPALEKCKHLFYNYEEIYDYLKGIIDGIGA